MNSLSDFILWMFWVFFLVLAIWIFIAIFADIFGRRDLSGWAKAGWIFLIFIIPETDQLIPSRNGYENTVTNADGSFDIWYGPSKPDDVAETNFIKTVAGRDFLAVIRLYGSEGAFFDQTWKPDDVVKVK